MSVGSLRIGVPSPTASSLGKFGDIPVSLYAGLPDIELPLYTVNVTALKRYNQSGSLMHNYTYAYPLETNRLQRVTGSGERYGYDANGNMRQDLDNNIGFTIYDIFNRPVSVYTTGGAEHRYYYDHNGNRVRKRIGGSSDYYVNGIDGRTDVVTNNTSSWATYTLYGLDQIGQVRRDGIVWTRFYYLKDHVGSVKVIVNASGNRVAHTDMDPFGYEMPGRVQDSSSVDGRYKFTGKERDTETTYDYFGARYYDARIARWLQVDPLAGKYVGWSPYVYVYNNPIKFDDPDGEYSRHRLCGIYVYRRWTTYEVQKQILFENFPVIGAPLFFERAFRGDKSFRPSVDEYIGFSIGRASRMAARTIGAKGLGVFFEKFLGVATKRLQREQEVLMKADRLAFEELVNMKKHGFLVAVHTTYWGIRREPVATRYETGKIMLNPYLRQYLHEELEWRLEKIDVWFEKIVKETRERHYSELKYNKDEENRYQW
jgi:RHS repeat-associated protein